MFCRPKKQPGEPFGPSRPREQRSPAIAPDVVSALAVSAAPVHGLVAAGAWGAEGYIPNVGELLQELIAGAERQLAPWKERPAAQGLTVKTAVITGRPAQSIIEHAGSAGCDLIVMATHGRTGLSHAVMGSVAERVLRKAPCPVLTVRGNADASETAPAAA